MLLAGKVYSTTQQYVRQVPQAITLFRKVSEHQLSAEDLQKLEEQAEQLAKQRSSYRR